MGHEGQEFWLKDALVFLVTAGLVVPLLRLGRVPAVLGFLIAGVVAGPFGLGRFAADAPALAFITIADPKAAEPFAELGILFLLFVIGLDLSVERLWLLRKVAFGAGLAQALGSAAVIAAIAAGFGIASPAAWTIGLRSPCRRRRSSCRCSPKTGVPHRRRDGTLLPCCCSRMSSSRRS